MGSEAGGIAATGRAANPGVPGPGSGKSARPMKPPACGVVCSAGSVQAKLLDPETQSLVQRWIIAFCEAPVLIDAELMRRVLDEAEAAEDGGKP